MGRGGPGDRAGDDVCGGVPYRRQVLGAFAGEKMVGYTLAVVGCGKVWSICTRTRRPVSAVYRNRGVGRMLKLFQRDEAVGRGFDWWSGRLTRWN